MMFLYESGKVLSFQTNNYLKLPKSSIIIQSGLTSAHKKIAISAKNESEILGKIAAIV
jgi:uncharacterized protein YggU (UPF0235/DUF167 family)